MVLLMGKILAQAQKFGFPQEEETDLITLSVRTWLLWFLPGEDLSPAVVY